MGDKTVNTTMPLFHRSPRTYLAPPTAELELQPPQGKPARPTSSLVAVLLPLFFTVLGLGLTVAFLATNASYLLLSLPLMIGSGLVSIINYFNERKKYRESIAQRDQTYRAYLAQQRQQAEALANEQRRALLDPHPDPNECLRRAGAGTGQPSPRLWERSSGLERPRDPDFLHLRLWLGALPATFQLKPPSSRPPVGEADDLYDEALRLVDDFRQVDSVPIVLPLAQAGAAGLSGPPRRRPRDRPRPAAATGNASRPQRGQTGRPAARPRGGRMGLDPLAAARLG